MSGVSQTNATRHALHDNARHCTDTAHAGHAHAERHLHDPARAQQVQLTIFIIFYFLFFLLVKERRYKATNTN